MPTNSGIPDDELARARLAWISAGQKALSAPRRALPPDDHARGDPGDGSVAAPVGDEGEAAGPSPGAPAGLGGLTGLLPPAVAGALEQALRRRYVVAVLLLLLVGLGITMAVLSRSSASQVPIQTPPVVATQVPSPVESSPPEPVLLRVHVLGAVVSPGVVAVPEGAIVADALTAAGGLLPEADPAQLNLAARLADGQQVIVGTRDQPQGDVRGQPAPDSPGGQEQPGKVNLNTATQGRLEELPGVGPVLAGEIIAWREANGGFSSVADLQEVSGIGPKTYEALEPLVTV
ncbi:hypothetical protein GCM10028820_28560 [Tessaracoccus terricola]